MLLIPLGLEVRSSTNPDANKKRTKAKTTNEESFPPTWDRWKVLLGLSPIVGIIPELLIIYLWILCKSQISKITTISQLILKLSLFSTILTCFYAANMCSAIFFLLVPFLISFRAGGLTQNVKHHNQNCWSFAETLFSHIKKLPSSCHKTQHSLLLYLISFICTFLILNNPCVNTSLWKGERKLT